MPYKNIENRNAATRRYYAKNAEQLKHERRERYAKQKKTKVSKTYERMEEKKYNKT